MQWNFLHNALSGLILFLHEIGPYNKSSRIGHKIYMQSIWSIIISIFANHYRPHFHGPHPLVQEKCEVVSLDLLFVGSFSLKSERSMSIYTFR